jgi:hypothetical protein
MSYEVFIGDRQGVEDRLNNVLVIGPFPSTGLPVGGKTLIFNTPVGTVTFSGALGSTLTIDQIITEIKAALATLTVTKRVVQNATKQSATLAGGLPVTQVAIVIHLTSGFTIDSAGTSNADFGLSTTADTIRAAAVATAKIAGFSQGSTAAHYALVIDLS